MTLRTPRRRISPRTKRRCRVIRNFFRRAIGSSSQPEIKIGSSIAVNVTDLKHKIVGLEHQLNEVSQHCQDLACLETRSKDTSLAPERKLNAEIKTSEAPSLRYSEEQVTKLLYKTSESHYKQSDESDYGAKFRSECDRSQSNIMNTFPCDTTDSKPKKKNSKLYSELKAYDQNLSKRRTKSVNENFGSFYSTSSYHSIIDPKMAYVHKGDCNERQNRNYRQGYIEIEPFHLKDKKNREHVRDTHKEEKRTRSRKIKHNRELDQDFIADIIKRQYKPVKMFGRKESDLSQFSAPVCRDQEYLLPEETRDTELCSCCYESRRTKHKRHRDLSDMRSICDTRLYSSKRRPRSTHRRVVEVYNDSDLYDLVPVKEKSSPKSRRKFAEDNMIAYSYYKEVPPSPRTHRPRLNLKAQYFAEFEDFLAQKRQNIRNSPARSKRIPEKGAIFETDISEMPPNCNQFNQKQKSIHQNRIHVQKNNTGTVSSLHSPKYVRGNEIVPETVLNKTQETDLSIDKTDKALSEIKDILQSFLIEIKKETTASQCDKSDVTSKVHANDLSNPHNSANAKPNIFPNSGHSFNYNTSCNVPQCMPAFPNTCCYPVLPMCTMNPIGCMQNGYAVPTPSFTCATCANKETAQDEKPSKSANNAEFCNPETEELIKEIYKYVAQSPRLKTNNQESERREKDKLLTSRSVGGSTRGSRRDANVGTPKMKCYSKSCEAISSRLISDTYYSGTSPSYSDTLLEKLSVEATPTDSISETDFTTETSMEKGKNNKLAKVLRTFGLMKKKKKDVIEELSESESAIDVEIKTKPPFKQKITNYMMHGQEYFHPPPVPPMHHYPPPDFHEHHAYLPRVAEHPPHEPSHPQRVHHTPHTHNQTPYHPSPMPTAPPYSQAFDNYNQMQQNVPLCLKEIEVKSIGTQSERKMSFFRKMKTKMQQPGMSVRSEEMPIRNCSTQTAQTKPQSAPLKPNLFNWKNLQKPQTKMDPMAFSYMKQKQLAEGDFKIRDAMVKKLFYKRNPFSPRNLLVRTILGKDKSSYGDPPTMYRPRMFF